jgi:hypothetical protein
MVLGSLATMCQADFPKFLPVQFAARNIEVQQSVPHQLDVRFTCAEHATQHRIYRSSGPAERFRPIGEPIDGCPGGAILLADGAVLDAGETCYYIVASNRASSLRSETVCARGSAPSMPRAQANARW